MDMTAITGLATSLRSAVEITKAMKDIHDANLIQTKVFELTREILSAQTCALDANTAQTALLEENRGLRDKVAKLETWQAEKTRYQLTEVGEGLTAYTLKPGLEHGEPKHVICANCFQDGIKSVLQTETRFPGRCEVLVCHRCGADLYIHGGREPEHHGYKRPSRR
jgi:hypothetical protein